MRAGEAWEHEKHEARMERGAWVEHEEQAERASIGACVQVDREWEASGVHDVPVAWVGWGE